MSGQAQPEGKQQRSAGSRGRPALTNSLNLDLSDFYDGHDDVFIMCIRPIT
jgi:hypothetical protein